MPLQSANIPLSINLDQWTGTGQGDGGVNQAASRSAIGDQDMFWAENLIPIAPGELRSAWGPSAPIYSLTSIPGVTILRIFFTNINSVDPVGFMFRSDGLVDQVNLNTGFITSLGRVWNPVPPYYWADLKLWAPNQYGNTPGQTGGVVIGSPLGLYAWDGQNVTGPGANAPLWLTNGATQDQNGNQLVMPSGLPGIYAMEVYLQRLWVMGQTVISFSAPDVAVNFSASGGGGSFGYYGDQLTVSYTDMKASNGFLYVFGDSLINVVSGLQLVGQATPIGTIYTSQFNYSNVNPQIGMRYFREVGVWLQNLAVFDGAGIFLQNQQQLTWISEKLTNLIATVVSGAYQPTLTTATIFGQRWLLVNGQFTDPWGVSRSMILAWNGAIWTILSQGVQLTHIGSYTQNSVITPYGTDGTSLYKLFAQPDPNLEKRFASKQYTGPQTYLTVKDWKRTYIKFQDNMSPPGPEGVYLTGTYSAAEGGVPGGSQSVSFEIPPGAVDTRGYGTEGKGIIAWLDLRSRSPDFTIERIMLTYDNQTLFGA